MGLRTSLVLLLLVVMAVVACRSDLDVARAASEAGGFREEEINFRSGELTLHGTVLVPDGASPGPKPGLVMVHGAGPGPRERTRPDAEAFAREGIVTLVYDKRTEGYSQFERSYESLADDALAAARALRDHPDVDPAAVGLWGLSEGAWVAPLAAARSGDVAFVVLVAATGVPPARQHAWNLENQLRYQGVSGSMVKAVSRTGTRVIVDAGLFAEANHDPVAPLERVQQPVLALYGEKDRVEPPAESARILREALERGGNDLYTIRFFPNAEHGLHASPDGFVVRDACAPGYSQTVGGWVHEAARGEASGPAVAGPLPEQARPSRPLAPLAWWESGWVQLGAVVLPTVAFASYPMVTLGMALTRLVRRCSYEAPESRLRRWARWLAGAGLAAVLGFVCYFGYLTFTGASAVGPVIAGRPLPWLALQALALATVASTAGLAASWSARGEVTGAERARLGFLLVGGVVFLAWAAYWGLLVP